MNFKLKPKRIIKFDNSKLVLSPLYMSKKFWFWRQNLTYYDYDSNHLKVINLIKKEYVINKFNNIGNTVKLNKDEALQTYCYGHDNGFSKNDYVYGEILIKEHDDNYYSFHWTNKTKYYYNDKEMVLTKFGKFTAFFISLIASVVLISKIVHMIIQCVNP